MNVSRALTLAKKDWKRIFREPAFLFMIILFPVMLTIAFGTSFGAVGGSQSVAFKVGWSTTAYGPTLRQPASSWMTLELRGY